jgi:hypothetical protein
VQTEHEPRLLARGRGGRDRRAIRILDEGVAAFERARRLVGREGEREALEVAPPRRRGGAGRAGDRVGGGGGAGRVARDVALARVSAPAEDAARRDSRRRNPRRRPRGVRVTPSGPKGSGLRRRRRAARSPAARAGAGAGARGGARRARPARARARRASRARSTIARRPWRSSRAAAARQRARAPAQSTGTAASAACVGVEHETAATSSISVRSVWWPTDAMTGTRRSATVRHSVSSQNANRSASEPPPRATTMTSTSSQAARSDSARMIAGAAWRSCTGANAHTTRPAQPRRRRPASTSSRALPVSAHTTPIARGSAGRGRRFCTSNRPLASSARRSRDSWASRSPSPASRSAVTANEKDGEDVRDPT